MTTFIFYSSKSFLFPHNLQEDENEKMDPWGVKRFRIMAEVDGLGVIMAVLGQK
jgi:hypothetical protein